MTGGPGWSVGGSAFAGRARALGLSGAVWAGVGKMERESRPGWAARGEEHRAGPSGRAWGRNVPRGGGGPGCWWAWLSGKGKKGRWACWIWNFFLG